MRFLLLLILFCVPTFAAEYDWIKIEKQDVEKFLSKTNGIVGAHSLQATSQTYCVPTLKWIEIVYSAYLKNFLVSRGVSTYLDPENNCVKFSTYALTAGYLLHYKENQGPIKTSLAIGSIDYYIDKENAHSANFFLAIDDTKNLVIVYYEPQTQSFISKSAVKKVISMRL